MSCERQEDPTGAFVRQFHRVARRQVRGFCGRRRLRGPVIGQGRRLARSSNTARLNGGDRESRALPQCWAAEGLAFRCFFTFSLPSPSPPAL